MSSDRDADFYSDPANLEPGPAPARRKWERAEPKTYSAYVPVRFPAELIEAVKALAEEDGRSLSAWIRIAVDREVKRRKDEADKSV